MSAELECPACTEDTPCGYHEMPEGTMCACGGCGGDIYDNGPDGGTCVDCGAYYPSR